MESSALRAAWHPVALSAEIGEAPTGVWLLDQPWVLYRTPGGEARAFVDRCPHRLAPLSAGRLWPDGTIQCGYHGWRFDDRGACVAIPALGEAAAIPPRARLTPPAALAERAGLVWLAPEPPRSALVDVAPVERALHGALTPVRAEADPGELIDNFLDVAHFPFVHAGTFGVEASDEVDDYDIEPLGDGFRATTEHSFANREDPGVATGERALIQRRRMTYIYVPPFTATLQLDYLDAGGTNLIVFSVQPERGRAVRVYTTLARNDVAAEAMPAAIEFEQRVLAEDLAIQQRLTVSLPLDLTVEVHTKADRLTIELRRRLAAFVARWQA